MRPRHCDTALCSTLLAVFVFACGGDPILECADAKGIHPVCGFQNPEDLALLDDGRSVLVSQFGGMEGEQPGSLALFDLPSEQMRVVYRAGAADERRPGWGADDCPGPPPASFAPHGIDLALRPDGALRLLVVNHGEREAIEAFEVSGRGAATRVAWRGCAPAPEGAFLNDVVSLPDGGFLTTHMMDRESQLLEMLRAGFGRDTGFVYEWQPKRGFTRVAGTDGPFPNGIELSADGREIFVNYYLGNEVRRIRREDGALLASASVQQPDNSSWSRDGRLLVASHRGGFSEQMACMGIREGACPMGFEIVALDAKTLAGGPVLENSGAPMGAATVAIDVGGELLMGSFAGDRVIRASFP